MSPFQNPPETGKVEKVRNYMTRSMPERLHYRLAVMARRERTTIEKLVNLCLERGLNVMEEEKNA